jgi:hypothetical protein
VLQRSGETNRDLDRHQPTDERLRGSKDEDRDWQQHHTTEVQPGPVVRVEDAETDPREQHHGGQREDSTGRTPRHHNSSIDRRATPEPTL